MKALKNHIVTLGIALGVSLSASGFNVIGDGPSQRKMLGRESVVMFTKSGKVTVTGSGSVQILLVGGGGGGGIPGSNAYAGGGGGGAGGYVSTNAVPVAAGEYDVVVGAGGLIGQNGGDSSVFGITAYGGGHGANGDTTSAGSSGGSGGGACISFDDCVNKGVKFQDGALAGHLDENNCGNAGGK